MRSVAKYNFKLTGGFSHMFPCSLPTMQFSSLPLNKRITPMGFPQGCFLPDPVIDRSLKASCPFKSFISITQQVQWHTSNKQPEKEN